MSSTWRVAPLLIEQVPTGPNAMIFRKQILALLLDNGFTRVAADAKIVIPAGQFGLLVTREAVRIPANVIAFISIRAGIKFQGLVNVSGFHGAPGYMANSSLPFLTLEAGQSFWIKDSGCS